jgi:hypothetical protein
MSRTEPAVASLHSHTQLLLSQLYPLYTVKPNFTIASPLTSVISPKHWYPPIGALVVTAQNSNTDIFTALRTSHLIHCVRFQVLTPVSMKMAALWVERYTKEGCHPDTLSIIP